MQTTSGLHYALFMHSVTDFAVTDFAVTVVSGSTSIELNLMFVL